VDEHRWTVPQSAGDVFLFYTAILQRFVQQYPFQLLPAACWGQGSVSVRCFCVTLHWQDGCPRLCAPQEPQSALSPLCQGCFRFTRKRRKQSKEVGGRTVAKGMCVAHSLVCILQHACGGRHVGMGGSPAKLLTVLFLVVICGALCFAGGVCVRVCALQGLLALGTITKRWAKHSWGQSSSFPVLT
jgi:hypothetical protein